MEGKKRKVGIVTFWWSQDNYGQLLQAFALQTVLKRMGHEPFLVNFMEPTIIKKGIVAKFKRVLNVFNPTKLKNYLKKRIVAQHSNRGFSDFRKKHLNIASEQFRSLSDLKNSPPKADLYICGSDQVWNRKDLNNLKVYLLSFGNIPKISYAASFGKRYDNLNEDTIKVFETYLPKFQAISVRERSGMEACDKLGYPNAVWVPDPTLLLTKEDYADILIKDDVTPTWKTNKKRVLIYTVGNQTVDCKENVINFLKKQREYEVIHVSSQGDYTGNMYPTIEKWLSYMQQADFVLTNSFHGAVFSVIFNKEFAVLLCDGGTAGMNERIYSLLEKTKQKHKILDSFDKLNDLLADKSDWSFVEKEIVEWRVEAKDFLEKNI